MFSTRELFSLPPLRRRLGGWRGAAKAFYFLALAAVWLIYFVDAGFFLYPGERLLNAAIIELTVECAGGCASRPSREDVSAFVLSNGGASGPYKLPEPLGDA